MAVCVVGAATTAAAKVPTLLEHARQVIYDQYRGWADERPSPPHLQAELDARFAETRRAAAQYRLQADRRRIWYRVDAGGRLQPIPNPTPGAVWLRAGESVDNWRRRLSPRDKQELGSGWNQLRLHHGEDDGPRDPWLSGDDKE